MKFTWLVCLALGLSCLRAFTQTADDYVNQGLNDLSAHDIIDANTSFSTACTLSAADKNANALYAITQVLVLPYQAAGSNFLTRIGMPTNGRNIYDWTAQLPEGANKVPLAPAGVNAEEFISQARTNILPAISGAIGNLSVITDTNYAITLTSAQTAMTTVTVDYGDLKMIQAGLYASEYLIYTLNEQNLNAQLTAIRALYTNGALSAGEVLSDYPQLFTFSTTNDLHTARDAFSNAVNNYMVASAFIRDRPADEVRLFNYDEVSATSEVNFRSILTDLENSLADVQILSVRTNLMVSMANSFNGTTTLRSLLPKFQKNAIVLGSFPDLTFGGVVDGLSRDDVEGFLSKELVMLPFGNKPGVLTNTLQLSFNTLRGHYYVLETSTNLAGWSIVDNFTATNATTLLIDPQSSILTKRFYRLRDDTGFLSFSGVVLDQNTDLPIADAQIYSLYDGSVAYTDFNGQFYLGTSLQINSWGPYDDLEFSAPGYVTSYNFYYDNGLDSGLQIYLSP